MFPIFKGWQHQQIFMFLLLLLIFKKRFVMGLPAKPVNFDDEYNVANNMNEAKEGTHSNILPDEHSSDHTRVLNVNSHASDPEDVLRHQDDNFLSVVDYENDRDIGDAIKDWRSVDHQKADKAVNEGTNYLVALRNELQHFQTEEKAKLASVNEIHRKASNKLQEELKRNPSLQEKLSTQSNDLKNNKEPAVQSWLEIIERAKLFKKPSTKPAFVKWLIKSFWKNPRDLVMKAFGGKYYRSWAAWRYLKSMVSNKSFRSREDIQEALEVFQKMGKSRLTDDQCKLIILLKKEGIQGFKDKHKVLISEASRLGLEENMIIPKNTKVQENVQQHMQYLVNMIHNVQFSDDDKLELARLAVKPSPESKSDQLEILHAKESVSQMMYDELEKADHVRQKLAGNLKLTSDEEIFLKNIYNHPETLHNSPEELSEAERKVLSDISHLYETRRRFIVEQKAEVELLQDIMKNPQLSASQKLERLQQIRENRKNRKGLVLMEDSDMQVMGRSAQQADKDIRIIKIPSTEKTKSGEILVDRSEGDIVVLEPEPTKQNEDVKAVRSLEGLDVEGPLKDELGLIVQKLQNRPFVLTKGEQEEVFLAAEEAKKRLSQELDVELAKDMLELSYRNHFFPDAFDTSDTRQRVTLQKILRGERLELRESVMMKSLAAAYRQHIVNQMTEPELALLSVRKFKHTMTNTLMERIERYSLGPDEYFTIMMSLQKKKYFTSDQWFLSFLNHAENSGEEISPELEEVKRELEHSIHLSPHSSHEVDHFNANVKLAIVKQLEEEGSDEEGRHLNEAMEIIGSATMGTTDFERLQLISQMNVQEIRALFERQDNYEELEKLVKEAQHKLAVVKEYDARMHIFDKEAKVLKEKVGSQRLQSELSSQYLEQTRNIFNEKMKALDMDHQF
ncbi:hypothetical protein DFH28DRAFT_533233 [Melampsora americana]|nr:hypothetical protein DFH28DRAFT_533233 [Melampsora americana]